MGFSRQEHWNELPCLPSGDLPNPRIEPTSHVSPELAGVFLTTSTTWEVLNILLKKLHSCVPVFVTPWIVTHQAPLSLGFPKQEHWGGLPFPSPRGLPDPGIEPGSPALQADSLPSEPPGKPLYPFSFCQISLVHKTDPSCD